MSERTLRRRGQSIPRNSIPTNPSPTPRRRRSPRAPPGASPPRRRPSKLSKPVKILKRSSSEPSLWRSSICFDDNQDDFKRKSFVEYEEGVLFRPQTCSDVFASSHSLMSFSSQNTSFERYKKDAKVVVNVTVEGSPGPIKAMVKLGSSVKETIEVVVDKYSKEGRTPKLDYTDAVSAFELHHSHFSLENLEKSELIGDIGSRSFYLRRSGSNRSNSNEVLPLSNSEIVLVRANSPSFLLGKFARRVRKLWMFMVCER